MIIRSSAVCAILCLGFGSLASTGTAQTTAIYAEAERHAASGDAAAMEGAYSAILQSNPDDRRALIGRATARSWAGNRSGARADYNRVLSQNPNDLEVLIGLGYDYAWGEDYSNAEQTFKRALAIDPGNTSAKKGLAYTALWRGRASDALQQFQQISRANPQDAEAYEGQGQAHLKLGHAGRAEAAFDQALRIDPTRNGALDGKKAAYGLPSILEASLWVGNSAEGGDVGVRSAELASWVQPRTRIGVRYDNSLSLDNPALARSGQDAETLYVSAQHQFNNSFIGVAEFGHRTLPAGADQQIFKAEGIFLDGDRSYKIGGQFSPHSDGFDDTLVYGGVNFPVVERVRMDATVFVSESGVAGDQEVRGALYTEYTAPERWTVGAGVGFGDISSDIPGADGTVTTAHILASVPVAQRHTAFVQARWEDAPLNEYSAVMVGVTLRLPRQ